MVAGNLLVTPAGCFSLVLLAPISASLACHSDSTCHGFMDDSEARLGEMKPQRPTFEKWVSQCIDPDLEVVKPFKGSSCSPVHPNCFQDCMGAGSREQVFSRSLLLPMDLTLAACVDDG